MRQLLTVMALFVTLTALPQATQPLSRNTQIAWDANPEPGLFGYRLYISTNNVTVTNRSWFTNFWIVGRLTTNTVGLTIPLRVGLTNYIWLEAAFEYRNGTNTPVYLYSDPSEVLKIPIPRPPTIRLESIIESTTNLTAGVWRLEGVQIQEWEEGRLPDKVFYRARLLSSVTPAEPLIGPTPRLDAEPGDVLRLSVPPSPASQ